MRIRDREPREEQRRGDLGRGADEDEDGAHYERKKRRVRLTEAGQ